MKNVIMFIVAWLLLSCTKEVEVEIPNEQPKIVVFSTIVPFSFPIAKPLAVTLQSSLHISDSDTSSISDAVVLYFENEILKDTLQYNDTLRSYPISNSISDYPTIGNTYSIQISKEGYEPVSATTTIPTKVTISDTTLIPIAYIDETGSAVSEIALTFKDPQGEINFYEIALSDIFFKYDSSKYFYELLTNDNLVTSENYYPSLIRFDIDKPKRLLFSDKAINGEEYTFRFYYTPPQIESDHRYISNHYVSIHFRNVTEDYYRFHTSMLLHLYNRQGDVLYGMAEPINLLSNINNGFGLFAGFNTDVVSLFVPEQIITK